MVFERIGHLARFSAAGKPAFHAYQQSFYAASHQSTFRHKQNKVSRPQTSHLHSVSKDVPSTAADANKASGLGATEAILLSSYGFNTYLETWKKAREEGIEWQQGKFPKSIEWVKTTVEPDLREKGKVESGSRTDSLLVRTENPRVKSTSAVDDIKKVEDEAAEAVALAKVNEAISLEISQIRLHSTSKNEHARLDDAAKQDLGSARDSTQSIINSPVVSAEDSAQSPPLSDVTAATSIQELESQAFSEHISRLHGQQSYGQIPAVFESMVVQGLRPSVQDYNALLASAIRLPIAKHQVIPKVLNVYSDILRRKVTPDTAFYTTIIEVLSHRALEVLRMKNALEKKRLRFGGLFESGKFLFASNEAELSILAEDDSLRNAVKVFDISTSIQPSRLFPAELYKQLIIACAMHGQVDNMIRIFGHMEAQKVKPVAFMFPHMIEAFAKSKELVSALESYNGYKSLAIDDNAGNFTMIDRTDDNVYTALIKAYAMCNKSDGANRFIAKILGSYADVTLYPKERLDIIQDSLILDGLVQERLDVQDFHGAIALAEERLSPSALSKAMTRVCSIAADYGDAGVATKAYKSMSLADPEGLEAVSSMLALSIRQGDLPAARTYWSLLSTTSYLDISFVEPVALYAVMLIQNGFVDEALTRARDAFGQIRSSAGSTLEANEQIDEAIEFIGAFIAKNIVVPTPNGSLCFLWAMMENGGLVSPIAEQLLAGLGPEDIASLSYNDIVLALKVQAGLFGSGQIIHDIAHSARFGHLLEIAVTSGASIDESTNGLIEKALGKLANERPDLIDKWKKHQQTPTECPQRVVAPMESPTLTSPFADTHDPYAASTDFRGSTIITEELEARRNSAGLNEALLKFRNIRRAGRHPRYIGE